MLERVENIKQYSKYDLLQMIKVSLVRDKFAAMEFLKLCYKKKRNMRKIVNNIEYIYGEKIYKKIIVKLQSDMLIFC